VYARDEARGEQERNTTSRQNARHLSVTPEKTPRLSLALSQRKTPTPRQKSGADRIPPRACVQTRRTYACHGPEMFVNPTSTIKHPARANRGPYHSDAADLSAHPHALRTAAKHIAPAFLSPRHGSDDALLIDFSIAGHSHLLPWSGSRVF
jgi:hypothetical protein